MLPLPQPTLRTARLLLRSVRHADVDDLYSHINDRDIMRNTLNIPWPYQRSYAQDWVAETISTDSPDKGYRFVICLPQDERLMGMISLHDLPLHHRAETGYWIGRPYWNQGYMTEALKAVIDFAFHHTALRRVQAAHFTYNPQSGRVMAKAGMRCEGTLRQYLSKGDEQLDLVMWAITRLDWLTQQVNQHAER